VNKRLATKLKLGVNKRLATKLKLGVNERPTPESEG